MLMNSEFILQQAGYFAARIRKEAAGDPTRQVQTAWQLAFARAPEAGGTGNGRWRFWRSQPIPRPRRLRRRRGRRDPAAGGARRPPTSRSTRWPACARYC